MNVLEKVVGINITNIPGSITQLPLRITLQLAKREYTVRELVYEYTGNDWNMT